MAIAAAAHKLARIIKLRAKAKSMGFELIPLQPAA
jgi:hypothetical protein